MNPQIENRDNPLYDMAFQASVDSVKLCKRLMRQQDYTILAPICNQLTRSATSIFANISEGNVSFITRKDRKNKFLIALKELEESVSWLRLLLSLDEIEESEFQALFNQLSQIKLLLSKSISTINSKTIK